MCVWVWTKLNYFDLKVWECVCFTNHFVFVKFLFTNSFFEQIVNWKKILCHPYWCKYVANVTLRVINWIIVSVYCYLLFLIILFRCFCISVVYLDYLPLISCFLISELRPHQRKKELFLSGQHFYLCSAQ